MVENIARLTCDRCGVGEDVALGPDEWLGDFLRGVDARAKGWRVMDDVSELDVSRYGEVRASTTRRALCPECAQEYDEFLAAR